MTETSIDEILSLLRDQKTDLEESVAFIKNTIGELRQKQNHANGRLYEIDYLIKYIEGDDSDGTN
jgi:hypothetical protein